jgi:hypothetical protein
MDADFQSGCTSAPGAGHEPRSYERRGRTPCGLIEEYLSMARCLRTSLIPLLLVAPIALAEEPPIRVVAPSSAGSDRVSVVPVRVRVRPGARVVRGQSPDSLQEGSLLPVAAEAPPSKPASAPTSSKLPSLPAMPTTCISDADAPALTLPCDCVPQRGFLESDRAFPRFIGPITNPIQAKDPRALTEFRILFVDNFIPDEHPLNGGEIQAYGFQLRLALTDRLSFIADKDGFATISPGTGASRTGALNIAAGLKYAFVRDVENQFLVVGGLQYEPQTGEGKVFQSQGNGLLTTFMTVGKEFAEAYHFISNLGYVYGIDGTDNSSYFYTSLHADRRVAQIGCVSLYALTEANWYHYTENGNRGIPPAIGEFDGLINIGTSGVAGNDLVTIAGGLKAILGKRADFGIALEGPVSNRNDLINYRIVSELILRY